MIESFTGAEFLKALAAGSLKEAITLEGMVKLDSNGPHAFLFSEGTYCLSWISIPGDIIERVEYLKTVRCKDHEHPLVRLHLKEPPSENKLACALADLIRQSVQRHSIRDDRIGPPIDIHCWSCTAQCNDGRGVKSGTYCSRSHSFAQSRARNDAYSRCGDQVYNYQYNNEGDL